jgi:KaiC/GvpD/RAD55 family RecA-like ATPase
MTSIVPVSTLAHDAEQAVLSAILLEPSEALAACKTAGLLWQHFADPANALIYGSCLLLERRGVPIDWLAIAAVLEDKGKLEIAGGKNYLGTLMDVTPTAANVFYHAQLVVGYGRGRAGDTAVHHEATQAEQVGEALARLDLPISAYLRFPFGPLDRVMGGIGPATISFLCARSAAGKTSFLLSLMCRMHAQGNRIYYAGLESRPLTLRTQWACRVLGLDPGDVLSGAYLAWPHAEQTREALKAELRRQRDDAAFHRVRFAPQPTVDLAAMTEICVEAHDFGADVVVIDHIDHVTAQGSPYVVSRETMDAVKRLKDRYELRMLIASQINREGMGADPFRNHRPVQEQHVKMGDHKLEVCDNMLGIYRPLRDDITKEDKANFEAGRIGMSALLEANTMAVNVMKHRLYGARAGEKVRLGFWRGEVMDSPDLAAHRSVGSKYLASNVENSTNRTL